jgi:gluconolactonase
MMGVRRHFFAIGAVSSFLCMLAQTGAAQSPPSILAPAARWELVSRAGTLFAEGVVAGKDGMIYASDLTRTALIKDNNPGGTIYRFDPGTRQAIKVMEPSGMSNGLHIDRHGDLIICQDADTGGRAVMRRNLASGAMSVVANSYQGKRFNAPNDVTSDARGRIYFTDARYGGAEPMELPNAVYRVDPDGRITQLATDILRPNGIEVSPDGKRLYVAASNSPRLPTNPHGPAHDRFGFTIGGIAVYDLDDQGNISNGRAFYRTEETGIDGMAMDTDGNLYAAGHNGNRNEPKGSVVVLAPDGKLIQSIALPEAMLSTNLGFGRGEDANLLYMTAAFPWRLYRIATTRKGHYFD